jgi:hypothetical protein
MLSKLGTSFASNCVGSPCDSFRTLLPALSATGSPRSHCIIWEQATTEPPPVDGQPVALLDRIWGGFICLWECLSAAADQKSGSPSIGGTEFKNVARN